MLVCSCLSVTAFHCKTKCEWNACNASPSRKPNVCAPADVDKSVIVSVENKILRERNVAHGKFPAGSDSLRTTVDARKDSAQE